MAWAFFGVVRLDMSRAGVVVGARFLAGWSFCGVARFGRFGWGVFGAWFCALCCLSFLVGVLCVLWALWALSSCGAFGACGDVLVGVFWARVVMFHQRVCFSTFIGGVIFLPGVSSGLLVWCGRFSWGFWLGGVKGVWCGACSRAGRFGGNWLGACWTIGGGVFLGVRRVCFGSDCWGRFWIVSLAIGWWRGACFGRDWRV